jgi:DNA repair photolyase
MKPASTTDLKQELRNLTVPELVEVCLRLVRFKKENKELLTYLLFESHNEQDYVASIREEMELQFSEINKSNIYYAKKTIRKIVRNTNKFIRYSGHKQTEVELLIHFCRLLKKSGIPLEKSVALSNIFDRQIQKIRKALKSLHEDLQYDYSEELKVL